MFNIPRWLVVAMLVILAGCQSETPPEADAPVPATAATSRQDDQPRAVILKVVTAGSYASELSKFRGRVVLVDMWATW